MNLTNSRRKWLKLLSLALCVALLIPLFSCRKKNIKTVRWALFSPFELEAGSVRKCQNRLNERLKALNRNWTVELRPYGSDYSNYDAETADQLFDWEKIKTENLRKDVGDFDLWSFSDGVSAANDPYLGLSVYRTYCENGDLLPLGDLLNQEQLKRLHDALPDAVFRMNETNHTLYGLGVDDNYFASCNFNQNALDKLQISTDTLKGDLASNMDLLRKAKTAGYIPLFCEETSAWAMFYLWEHKYYSLPICSNVALDTDGKFKNLWDLAEMRERIQFLTQAENEELLKIDSSFNVTDKALPLAIVDYIGSLSKEPVKATMSLGSSGRLTIPSLNVPNLDAPYPLNSSSTSVTAVPSFSLAKNEAADLLQLLFTDPVMVSSVVSLSRTLAHYVNFCLAADADPTLLKTTKQVYDKTSAFVPYGFNFDTRPVAGQIQKCNRIIGQIAYFSIGGQLDRLDPAVAALYQLENVESNREQVVRLLQEAGIDDVIAEANRQLHEWQSKASG